jgi:aspartate racemase
VVAATAAGRGYRRLGGLGTRWLVDSEVYPAALTAVGLEAVRPIADDRQLIHRIILDELVPGRPTAESVRSHQDVIDRLAAAGCDAVILGCTEIPLIIDDSNSSLPTLPRCAGDRRRPELGQSAETSRSLPVVTS